MTTDVLHYKKSGKYKQAVQGESNYQEHLNRAAQESDLEVDLFLEDHNKFDKNAVAVVFETDTVGYLSRADALKYRAAIKTLGHPQAIGTCAAKTIGGGEDRSYGIVLDIDIDNLQVEKISEVNSAPPIALETSVKQKNSTQSTKAKPQLSDVEKKKQGTVIAIILAVFICFCVLPIWVRSGLESIGFLPTSMPEPTRTPYILSFYLTQTAQPSNTPWPTWTTEPTATPEKLAWTACTLFIDQQLKLSSFDAQEYNPNGVIKAGEDYLVDVYYAVNNVTYSCLLARETSGDWRLLDLSIKE